MTPARRENATLMTPVRPVPHMADRTYKIIELVGISEDSFSDAVDDAIARADQTLQDLSWFEVVEERGSIVDGTVGEYQVKVKVAFELE